MSVQQCEDCRLALVRVVFDPVGAESDAWGCQLEEDFSDQTRDVTCPFFVGWAQVLPPPARSCKKSLGSINGCSTKSSGGCGSGGSCGTGGCGSGGCGIGDPADSLDVKYDREAEPEAFMADEVAAAAMHAHDHDDDDHDHDHDDDDHHNHGSEQVGEGPTQGDTRHRPSPAKRPDAPVDPMNEPPRVEPAPGVAGDPSIPDGHAPDAPDDGYPTEPKKEARAAGCSALKALERMGLGRDEDAPVPVPLDEAD